MSISPVTPSVIQEVSTDFIEKAILSINDRMGDKTWLQNNRKVEGQPTKASWRVPVFGILTKDEIETVAKSFRDHGWNAIPIYSPHQGNGNWDMNMLKA